MYDWCDGYYDSLCAPQGRESQEGDESPFAAFFFSKLIELTTAIGGQ
jgi:hypothetical protein